MANTEKDKITIQTLAQKIIEQQQIISDLMKHIREQDFAIKLMVDKIREYQAQESELKSGIKVKDGRYYV